MRRPCGSGVTKRCQRRRRASLSQSRAKSGPASRFSGSKQVQPFWTDGSGQDAPRYPRPPRHPPRSVASSVASDSLACEANGPECRARRAVRGGGPPPCGTRDMRQATRTGTTLDMRRIACRMLRVACRLRAALPLLPRRIPASGPSRERPQNRTKFYVEYPFIIKEISRENLVGF